MFSNKMSLIIAAMMIVASVGVGLAKPTKKSGRRDAHFA